MNVYTLSHMWSEQHFQVFLLGFRAFHLPIVGSFECFSLIIFLKRFGGNVYPHPTIQDSDGDNVGVLDQKSRVPLYGSQLATHLV